MIAHVTVVRRFGDIQLLPVTPIGSIVGAHPQDFLAACGGLEEVGVGQLVCGDLDGCARGLPDPVDREIAGVVVRRMIIRGRAVWLSSQN